MNYKKREQKTLQARIERFIQLGKAKHGDNRYDYSHAREEYINNRTPIHIKCNKCKSKPFLVYPFAHINKGDNQKGTCPNCYIPKLTVQDTRWDPNLPQRIADFKEIVIKKYGHRYSYPYLNQEYKNEESYITVVCHGCNSKPFQRKARSLKSTSRKGGCKTCNTQAMTDTIANKNRARLLRNQQTKNIPRKYGCIYIITNIKNNKFYIGYTTMSAKKRFKAHCDESKKLSRGNKKAKSYLHNAMNFHGFHSFSIEVLEEHNNVTPYHLAKLEMNYITKLKPHYNVSPGGEIGRSKIYNKKAS